MTSLSDRNMSLGDVLLPQGGCAVQETDHLFGLNFFHSVLYIIVFQASVLSFFDWSCRSAPKKSFTACWSVFHRFCTVLPFLRFASPKLVYFLQKLYGNPEKQYTFKFIFISSKEQL